MSLHVCKKPTALKELLSYNSENISRTLNIAVHTGGIQQDQYT